MGKKSIVGKGKRRKKRIEKAGDYTRNGDGQQEPGGKSAADA